MAKSYQNLFDGIWQAATAQESLISRNPANHQEILGEFPMASREQTEAALQAAAKAQPGWANTAASARAGILEQAATLVDQQRQELAELVTREVGKVLRESQMEVRRLAENFRFYAGEA